MPPVWYINSSAKSAQKNRCLEKLTETDFLKKELPESADDTGVQSRLNLSFYSYFRKLTQFPDVVDV